MQNIKNHNLCSLMSINIKKNVKRHHQHAEQKIILNYVYYLKPKKSFFISSLSI